MISRCVGCGVSLQNSAPLKDGYISAKENTLCERCFRIRHYNEYQVVSKDNQDYLKILSEIGKNDITIVVLSLLEFGHLEEINKLFGKNIILCLTKRDLLPKSLIDEKIKSYFSSKVDCLDIVLVSSIKNYQMDLFFELLKKYYSKDKNIYIVGYTNAGKSTLINKIIKNYTSLNQEITASSYPSTTLDKIILSIDGMKIIDTPGLINEGSIINYLPYPKLKKYLPNKEVKPKIYQVQKNGMLVLDDLLILKYRVIGKGSIIAFINNATTFLHTKEKDKHLKSSKITNLKVANKELVIEGLCFFKIVGEMEICLETIKEVSVYLRDSLID